jgi:hypothetical protein
MKVRAVLALASVLVFALANPAMADPIDGGCTVDAQSSVDSTTVADAIESDPFVVDPNGRLAWVARSPGPIMDHTWQIDLDVGGLAVPIASGGDANTDGTLESVGDESIPGLIERVDSGPLGGVIGQLSGIYEVTGEIVGNGGACSGTAWILIDGFGAVGITAAVVAALGALMMYLSGRSAG